MLERRGFLGAREQPAGDGDRLAGRDLGRAIAHVGLKAFRAARAEIGRDRQVLCRDERSVPIFVGEAEPAAGRVVMHRAGRSGAPEHAVEEAVRSARETGIAHVIIGRAVEHAHRADVQRAAGFGLGVERARDIAIGAHQDRRRADILDRLRDSQHIGVVHREADPEALAGAIVPRQCHGGLRRQHLAVGGPQRIGVRRLHARAVPAEAGEIGVPWCRPARAGARAANPWRSSRDRSAARYRRCVRP